MKTVAELGITQDEYDGLKWFVRAVDHHLIIDDVFDMRHIIQEKEDGHITRCIGGWVGFRMYYGMKDDMDAYSLLDITDFCHSYVGRERSEQLMELYYPISIAYYLNELWNPFDATAKQAAMVVRRYLETGKIDWSI